jgi:Flp pilus assembly pilin Flp
MRNVFKSFMQAIKDKDGATAVEYAVMLALITAAIILTVGFLGQTPATPLILSITTCPILPQQRKINVATKTLPTMLIAVLATTNNFKRITPAAETLPLLFHLDNHQTLKRKWQISPSSMT